MKTLKLQIGKLDTAKRAINVCNKHFTNHVGHHESDVVLRGILFVQILVSIGLFLI